MMEKTAHYVTARRACQQHYKEQFGWKERQMYP